MSDLEKYLLRNDVPLEMRISTLVLFCLNPAEFVRLGKQLLEGATPEEKSRCEVQVAYLNYLVRLRSLPRSYD